MSSVNKVDAVEMYVEGFSIPQVSEATGLSRSTLRLRLKKAGVLRGRAEGVRLAAKSGRLGSGTRGKTREFSREWRENISRSAKARAQQTACGISAKPSGYVEFTTGPQKGRGVHVVIMEARLGRGLLPDECVHHIDGDKHNNAPNNLALLTRSGRQRLHRFQNRIEGKKQ